LVQVGPGHIYNPAFSDHSKVGFNYRDCAAVNSLVQNIENSGQPVDSIIAAFAEGQPIGQDSWLFDQSAVMISVRNPKRITILDHSIIDP
jgi:glycosylphosphatidylinositol transamidase (GPIT) subunit GPI8